MSNWERLDTLENVCELIVDCPHSTPKWTDSGILVIRNQNIVDDILDLSNPSYTDEEHYLQRIKRAVPTKNDIVITREAPMGRVCLIPSNLKCCLGQRQVLLRASKKINSHYLYWALKSPFVQNQIMLNEGTGATVSNIRIPVLKAIKIPRFSKQVEQNIVKVLSVLSDKIQLNTQINQTLEQIAQAIFKSWFIDFDPVKAKAEAKAQGAKDEQANIAAMGVISGKSADQLNAYKQTNPTDYKQLHQLAQAFPSELEEIDGVEVPKGWINGVLGDFIYGRKDRVRQEQAVVLTVRNIGELVRSDEHFNKQIYSKSIDKYLKVYQWDWAYNPSAINNGAIGLHKINFLGAVSPVYEVFFAKSNYHWFLEKYLKLDSTKTKIKQLASGSVRQNLKLHELKSISCIIPSLEVVLLFNLFYELLFEIINLNNNEIKNLEKIRNKLLPKLFDGEI